MLIPVVKTAISDRSYIIAKTAISDRSFIIIAKTAIRDPTSNADKFATAPSVAILAQADPFFLKGAALINRPYLCMPSMSGFFYDVFVGMAVTLLSTVMIWLIKRCFRRSGFDPLDVIWLIRSGFDPIDEPFAELEPHGASARAAPRPANQTRPRGASARAAGHVSYHSTMGC